jgi:hypothetical protein
MKKFMLASAFSLIAATSAFADNLFFKDRVGGWDIVGNLGDGVKHPICAADFNYNDGSQFRLIKDLEDDELYIYFMNTDWNITDPKGTNLNIRVNFLNARGAMSGIWVEGMLLSKNAFHIRALNGERFVPGFSAGSRLQFVMPGNIPDTTITLTASNAAINKLVECYTYGKNAGIKKKLPGLAL